MLEHPVTAGVLRERKRGREVVVTVTSSLADLGRGGPTPQRLLETSPSAFGMVDFFAWARDPGEPEPVAADRKVPLTIAVAAERPPAPGAERGARVVVVASTSVLSQANWQEPELGATAMFVEGAISWLAAQKTFLDIPHKAYEPRGLSLSEGELSQLLFATVFGLPLTAALGGLLVWLVRRREAPR